MSPPTLGDLLHPDQLAGALAWGLQLIARPSPNTLADLAIYRGRSPHVLFPPPGRIPTARVTTRWSLPGLVSEDVAFPSLHEPIEPRFRRRYLTEYPEAHTVHARRIRPAGARSRLRLLYLHGYMQPETRLEEFALLASMALHLNADVIQLQPPYHGRRTPRGSRFSGEFYCTADLVRSLEALRQTVLDARTLLGWLLEEDAGPVGILGLSMGGALTMTLTCLDERFAFSIPVAAHMDLCALVADAPVLAGMREELRQFGWGAGEFGEFIAQIGWHALSPVLPPQRIHLFAASDDRFFVPAIVEEQWHRWGRPAIRWYPCSHMGIIRHLPEVVRAVAGFINHHDARALDATPPMRSRSTGLLTA